jgi:uncharacterized phage infection (PIP) family protein YhgE
MFKAKVIGEGLTADQIAELKSICAEVAQLAHKAATTAVGDRAKWFGKMANSKDVTDGLKRMDEYLDRQCIQLNFVRKNTGQIVDQVPAEDSDYGQVIPNIAQTTAQFRKAPAHVSSGLRIFAMNEIINAIKNNDRVEKLNYVYHEISHKVLGTVDYKYGASACEKLALDAPGQAVRNADNWGYFIAGVK